MVCIYCRKDTHVSNSRLQKRTNQVWRRRTCEHCKNVFTTLEEVTLEQAVRFNHMGHLEPFSRDKLFLSIYEACRHRKTAVSDATSLTATSLSKIRSKITDATIDRAIVVKSIAEVLKHFDKAAQVQYLAFHPLAR